jgi:pilus assembly protein Flp/PilA
MTKSGIRTLTGELAMSAALESIRDRKKKSACKENADPAKTDV